MKNKAIRLTGVLLMPFAIWTSPLIHDSTHSNTSHSTSTTNLPSPRISSLRKTTPPLCLDIPSQADATLHLSPFPARKIHKMQMDQNWAFRRLHLGYWVSLKTPHFIIESNSKRKSLTFSAFLLEHFYNHLATLFPPPKKPHTRLHIRIFKNPAAFKIHATHEGIPDASSFYSNKNRELVMPDTLLSDPHRHLSSLFHEATHQFIMEELETQLPYWLSEGLAEYFTATRWSRNGLRFGGKLLERLQTLRETLAQQSLISPDRLVHITRKRFYGPDSDLFYSESWLLVHFLLRHSPHSLWTGKAFQVPRPLPSQQELIVWLKAKQTFSPSRNP